MTKSKIATVARLAAPLFSGYPKYNPKFIAKGRGNCLSYALHLRESSPGLGDLSMYQSPQAQLEYVAQEINSYYTDKQLVIPALHKLGELPAFKKGYYPISLHYSRERNIPGYTQCDDFHFLVRNHDGFFSHRRGTDRPERTDSIGKWITSPELATLFYANEQLLHWRTSFPICVNYCFVGYLLVKKPEARPELTVKTQTKAQTSPSVFPPRFFTLNTSKEQEKTSASKQPIDTFNKVAKN